VLVAGKQFVRHVVPAVIKPLRVLWNEMIAFVFMAFGVMVAFSTWRKFTGDGDGSGNLFVLAAGGFCRRRFVRACPFLLRRFLHSAGSKDRPIVSRQVQWRGWPGYPVYW
jgi:hypothetical protein